MKTAQELFNDRFTGCTTISIAYKKGCLQSLKEKLGEANRIKCPYPIGTMAAGAWINGAKKGKEIYRHYVEKKR